MAYNNNKPEDLLPQWIIRVFGKGNRLCRKCDRDLTLDDLCGVELICTSFEDMNIGPVTALDTLCCECGDSLRIRIDVDLREFIQGVEGFYEYVAQFRMEPDPPKPMLPSPNTDPEIPLCDVDEGDDGESVDRPGPIKHHRFGNLFGHDRKKQNPIERDFRKRQKRKAKDHKGKITDEEFEAFRQRLAKASPKRSTKSFRTFMAKFGIDIDKDYSAEGGDQ